MTPESLGLVEDIQDKLSRGERPNQVMKWVMQQRGISRRQAAEWVRTAWQQWYSDPIVQAKREEKRLQRIAEAEQHIDKLMAQQAYNIQGEPYDMPQGSAAAKFFELICRMEGLLEPDTKIGTLVVQNNLLQVLRQHYGMADEAEGAKPMEYELPADESE